MDEDGSESDVEKFSFVGLSQRGEVGESSRRGTR